MPLNIEQLLIFHQTSAMIFILIKLCAPPDVIWIMKAKLFFIVFDIGA